MQLDDRSRKLVSVVSWQIDIPGYGGNVELTEGVSIQLLARTAGCT